MIIVRPMYGKQFQTYEIPCLSNWTLVSHILLAGPGSPLLHCQFHASSMFLQAKGIFLNVYSMTIPAIRISCFVYSCQIQAGFKA